MISLIAAADLNDGIGYENQLLCHLKDDMRHFVEKTKGKPIIMGYKTFASLGYKPLKGRFNIVLTNSPMAMTAEHFDVLKANENLVFESLPYIQFMIDQAPETEFMVIGGEKTYELFLPMASRIYLTSILTEFANTDAHFPYFRVSDWHVHLEKQVPKSKDNDHSFIIFTYERKRQL